MYRTIVKRAFDIFFSLLTLTLVAPLILLLALIIKLKLGSPVLFTQERPGMNGKVFTLYKFRTMTNETDELGILLPNEERITKLGKLIRKLSLDELPQLFNVLKGDISLIGPRPLLIEYLPYYSEEQARRHDVRPGITGWAQVNGRNTLEWDKRFELDVWYVDNQSFTLDIKILILTIIKVFKTDGVTPNNQEFVERFDEVSLKEVSEKQ